jgi:hypothetical protein
MQVTAFFDAMIIPMPPEISHVSVPTLVRSRDCAMDEIGNAIAATAAKAANALNGLFMGLAP